MSILPGPQRATFSVFQKMLENTHFFDQPVYLTIHLYIFGILRNAVGMGAGKG